MSIIDRIKKRFSERRYRRAYADSFVDSYLATQIRALREQRNWTQQDLATALGMKQSQVSRMEIVDNSSWQIRTLKRLAEAFDLALVVRLESFGNVIPEIVQFSRASLERPSFDDDLSFSDDLRVERQQGSSVTASSPPRAPQRAEAQLRPDASIAIAQLLAASATYDNTSVSKYANAA